MGRYIECFICEQNMLGVGIGVACRDRSVAFASTFAAFLTRGFDNLRMGVISQTNINVVGSHCGVSIGEEGRARWLWRISLCSGLFLAALSSTPQMLFLPRGRWSSPLTPKESALYV